MTKRYIKDALMSICAVAMCVVVAVMMVTTWAEHPAESPVSGYSHIASIGGGN